MPENNKDKFTLDDILNEYAPKVDGAEHEDHDVLDVEDIINETNQHVRTSVEESQTADEEQEESAEENDVSSVMENAENIEDEEDITEQELAEESAYEDYEEESHAPDISFVPFGGILERFAADAEELEDVIDDSQPDETDTETDETDRSAIYEGESEVSESEISDSVSSEKTDSASSVKRTRGSAFTMRTEDDGDTAKRPTAQSEYTDREDAEKIKSQIAQIHSGLTVRAAVLFFAAVFSLFITVANDLSLPLSAVFDRKINPSAYLFTNTILGIIAVGFSYSVISMGIKSIFSRKPDSDSVAAINIIVSIVAGLVTLFDPESLKASFFHLYTSVAIIGLLCNTLGKLCVVRRTQRNFEFVSSSSDFSAIQLVDDDRTVTYLTNGSAGKRKELAVMKRTGFIKDFMKNSYSSDLADSFAERMTPFMLAASVIVALMSVAFEKNSAGAAEKLFVFLASMSGTLSICSSVGLALVVNVPLAKTCKKLTDYSGVMLGYSSAEEFAEVNSVVIDAGHLFPTGTVEFVNLKMLGPTVIDKSIIYAASLASAGKSVTQPAFYKMLKGNMELIKPVTGCVSEDNMGVSGWIDSKRVILGNRKLMEKNGVSGLPPISAEESFAGGNCVMYLAVGGAAEMMYAVQLSVGSAAERWVQELEDEAVDIHIRCSDGFLTKELIAQLFDVSVSTIKLLPAICDEDCERITGYEDSVSASMFCSGHLPSFSMLLVAAKRVKLAANLGVALQYGAMILGIVISAVMMLTGSFSQITPTIVLIYNLAFMLLTRLMQSAKKI